MIFLKLYKIGVCTLFLMFNFIEIAQLQTYQQYVNILPSDNQNDIINKAANLTPSKNQLAWQNLELTAFLHFGINTFTNKEWGDGKDDPSIFNPKKFNADQWITTCKSAGFKLVILTAKHHDGFCLWPSKFTEYSIKNSPWKKGKGDIVKEVAEACKKHQIKFGLYLSPWDRNSKYYGTNEYNTYYINQLNELLTNYGTIDEVWLDGANGEGENGKKQIYQFEEWYKIIRNLQPSANIAIKGPDIRWVGTESGYGRETEWSVIPINEKIKEYNSENNSKSIIFNPTKDLVESELGNRRDLLGKSAMIWYPSETDVSIRPGWFYHPEDNSRIKSAEKLFDIYCSSVGRNSVLLLNIPPNKDGLIDSNDVVVLKKWRKLIKQSFSNNLIRNATVKCKNGLNVNTLTHPVENTYFTTTGKDTTCTIEFEWKNMQSFNAIQLQENIQIGQRIEQFDFEYWTNNQWVKIGEGTTVGYKRILKFKNINTNKFRLNIISSRSNPTLISIGLFKFQKELAYLPIIKDVLSKSLAKNLAKGKLFTFKTAPHPKYNSVASTGMTDGKIPSSNSFNDGLWTGWSGDNSEFVLDLGDFKSINSIKLLYFNQPSSWIFPPSSVTIYCSPNGVDYEQISFSNKFDLNKEGAQYIDFQYKILSCKYLKFVVNNYGIIPKNMQGAGNPAWLFLDEIIIN